MKTLSQAPMTSPADEAQSSTDRVIDPAIAFMKAGGASDQQLTDVRLQLARGTVFEVGITATEQSDSGAHDLMLCWDEIAQAVAGRKSLAPIKAAFAQIKAEENAAASEPGHYSWCVSHVVQGDDNGDPYTEHVGAEWLLPVPVGMLPDGGEVLRASICHLEEFTCGPQISIASGGEGTVMDADETDLFIDQMQAFLDNLRTARRQMNEPQA